MSWAPPTKAVQQGDLTVEIVSTTIGKVPLAGLSDGEESKDVLASVKLRMVNNNPTKKVEYRSWGASANPFAESHATLKDNFGNNYKRITFSITDLPKGAMRGTESLYPKKPATDVLVFEVPLDTTTHLDLELPAKNYGGEGTIRFRIPIAAVTRGEAK